MRFLWAQALPAKRYARRDRPRQGGRCARAATALEARAGPRLGRNSTTRCVAIALHIAAAVLVTCRGFTSRAGFRAGDGHAVQSIEAQTVGRARELLMAKTGVEVRLFGQRWPGSPNRNEELPGMVAWKFTGAHPSGRDPRLAPYTCRIFNACRRSDGALLFPEPLRSAELVIKACGIGHYAFARAVDIETEFLHDHAWQDLVVASNDLPTMNAADKLAHYMEIAYALNVARGGTVSPDVNVLEFARNGTLEPPSLHAVRLGTDMRPVLHVQDAGVAAQQPAQRNRATTFVGEWENNFQRVLWGGYEGFDHVLDSRGVGPSQPGSSHANSRSTAQCYRSIVQTGEQGDKLPPVGLVDGNPVFENSGLSKSERFSDAALVAGFAVGMQPAGAAQLNNGDRAGTVPESSSGRSSHAGVLHVLVCVEGLRQTDVLGVLDRLRRRMDSGADVRIEVEVQRASKNESASELQNKFYNADVVLSASDDILSNVVYMRPKSMVVEITPFGLRQPFSRRFAKQLHIFHFAHTALADEDSYSQCMGKRQPVSERQAEADAQAWLALAVRYKDGEKHAAVEAAASQKWNDMRSEASTCVHRQKLFTMQDPGTVQRAIYDRLVLRRLSRAARPTRTA